MSENKKNTTKYEVVIVGGAGHIGVPLALVLTQENIKTLIYDINKNSIDKLSNGQVPFLEKDGDKVLKQSLQKKTIGFTLKINEIKDIPYVIITIGTPIDEFHNPKINKLTNCIDQIAPYLDNSQTLILRSTVAPGVTNYLGHYLKKNHNLNINLALCPERIMQGKGLEEIKVFPQIVSGLTSKALENSKNLFNKINSRLIECTTTEAEFAKLVCNAYRYFEFAVTNQLYMLVESNDVDYNRLLKIIKKDYPRLQSMPGPGFSGGPCLMKDTSQLFSLGKHKFPLGVIAVSINESLPNFIVDKLKKKFGTIANKKIGIMGMAFKAESDDIRESLSYKLGKLLQHEQCKVFYTDEYVKDSNFISKEDLLSKVEIVIVGVAHKAYQNIKAPKGVYVIDLWNCMTSNEL